MAAHVLSGSHSSIPNSHRLYHNFTNFDSLANLDPSSGFLGFDVRCFRCGDLGHHARNCYRSVLCFKCGRMGHKMSSCKNGFKVDSKMVASSSILFDKCSVIRGKFLKLYRDFAFCYGLGSNSLISEQFRKYFDDVDSLISSCHNSNGYNHGSNKDFGFSSKLGFKHFKKFDNQTRMKWVVKSTWRNSEIGDDINSDNNILIGSIRCATDSFDNYVNKLIDPVLNDKNLVFDSVYCVDNKVVSASFKPTIRLNAIDRFIIDFKRPTLIKHTEDVVHPLSSDCATICTMRGLNKLKSPACLISRSLMTVLNNRLSDIKSVNLEDTKVYNGYSSNFNFLEEPILDDTLKCFSSEDAFETVILNLNSVMPAREVSNLIIRPVGSFSSDYISKIEDTISCCSSSSDKGITNEPLLAELIDFSGNENLTNLDHSCGKSIKISNIIIIDNMSQNSVNSSIHTFDNEEQVKLEHSSGLNFKLSDITVIDKLHHSASRDRANAHDIESIQDSKHVSSFGFPEKIRRSQRLKKVKDSLMQ